jgi:hypothetical protein
VAASSSVVPPTAPAGAPAPDWFAAEESLGHALGPTIARLFRRARASRWLWVPFAVVVSVGATASSARKSVPEEVKVVLRAREGVAATATALSLDELAAEVRILAFTTDQIVPVMKRHPEVFPDADDDPDGSANNLRDALKIGIDENDFGDRRQPGDPPRSALVAVAFTAPTGKLALAVARDLAQLLVDSGQEGQRALARRREEAIEKAVQRASAEYDALLRGDVLEGDPRVSGARARLLAAQAQRASVKTSNDAVDERQALTFEIIDRGRVVPPVGDRRVDLAVQLGVLLLIVLGVSAIVAGAFDPRIVGVEDLAALGAPVLGHVPRLPSVSLGDEPGRPRRASPAGTPGPSTAGAGSGAP